MLNYLRDPNQELPAEQQAEAAGQKEQDFLTVATKSKDARRSTTMLSVFFIIGLICLGLMIKKSAPKAAVASNTIDTEELKLEAHMQRVLGLKEEMFNRMDEIVNKFYEFSNVVQIDVSELVKNPFELETFLQNLKANEDDNTPIDAEMVLKEEIRQKAKDMKLYSVMQSQKGVCCMINNKILYEGDMIDDFKVKQIFDDKVILAIGSVEITLKISK